MILKSIVHTAFLVDDSEVDLFIQKRFIERSTFAGQIITFSSPLKALEALENAAYNELPSLIFLDLNMPMISGFEFLEKIKSISGGVSDKIKIVILSSSNSPADRLRALEYPNVIRFFSKPLNLDELNHLTESL